MTEEIKNLYEELKQREQNMELADPEFVQAAVYELLATKEKISTLLRKNKSNVVH